MKTQTQIQKKEEYKETELGLLPKEWKIKPFRECILKNKNKSKKIKQQNYKEAGLFPIVDQGQKLIAGYWDKEEDVYNSDLPIIVFGDHTRIVKFVDFPFVRGADGTQIIIPNESFDRKFFYYALKSINIPSKGYNRHYSILKEKKIPLPPLPEQRNIAFVLSTIQEAKEKTDAVVAALKELKKSLMKHLFTYGPVSIKEAENVELKETEIGKMPKEWEVARLGDVADYINGYPFKPTQWKAEGLPIIRIQNLTKTTDKINYFDGKIDERYKVKEGDLLISWSASIGIFKWNRGDAWLNQHIFKVDNFQQNICKNFFYYAIMPRIEAMKSRTHGSTMRHITKKEFLNVKIPLPHPKAQRQIALILSSVDARIEAEQNKANALQELFNSMLRDLMTAKIRINDLVIE
jgi:type I restriction enzyme S subunit